MLYLYSRINTPEMATTYPPTFAFSCLDSFPTLHIRASAMERAGSRSGNPSDAVSVLGTRRSYQQYRLAKKEIRNENSQATRDTSTDCGNGHSGLCRPCVG